MKAFFVACASMLLLSGLGLAQEKDASSISDQSEIAIEGLGRLNLQEATKGDGSIAIFTPINPQVKSCSGSCSGTSVGSWTCPDNLSCALDCTTRPPRRYCMAL